MEPDVVSKAFMHAVFDDRPLRRYVVVPDEREQRMIITIKIQRLIQLNRRDLYFTEEERVSMLKEPMSG